MAPDPDARLRTLFALRLDRVTADCVAALTAADVPHLLLKGPTTARWLYRDGTARGYGDTDLIVPPAQHARAIEVLVGLGFADIQAGWRPHERSRYATALYRTAGDTVENVDLHHGLALVPGDGTRVWEVLSREVEWTRVAGQSVRMPAEPARCLILSLHAAQHGRGREKSLEDLRRALVIAGPRAWARAREFAVELGVTRAFELGHRLAGAAGPTTDWDGNPVELRVWAVTPPRGTMTLARIRRLRGTARLREIGRRIAPSPAFIRHVHGARTPLPIGYLLRAVTLARRLPGAARCLARITTAPPEFRDGEAAATASARRPG